MHRHSRRLGSRNGITAERILPMSNDKRLALVASDTPQAQAAAHAMAGDHAWVALEDADIAVVLGTSAMPIHQVLRLGRGAIIELDASEEDEVSILANNLPVAKGTVIVSGNKIAVEVKQILPRTPVEA